MSRNNPRQFHARRGFTLLELLFVVAIIGVLATTAIAMFQQQQQRAKRSEAMTNLNAIAKLETGYYGENGNTPSSSPVPLGAPGAKQNWDDAAFAGVPGYGFDRIGFSTEGSVYYVYDVNSSQSGCTCASNGCFTAAAYGDSDKDGSTAAVAFYHADAAGTVCDLLTWPLGGVVPVDPATGNPMLEQPADIFMFAGAVMDDY